MPEERRHVHRRRQPHHLGQQATQARTQFLARDDHVDGTVFQQELTALEAFWQFLAHGLLDHPRTGEADQRLGFADDHVAEHRQTGGYTTVNRVGQYGNERQALFAQACQHGGGLGHLHQRDQRFLHPRTAGSREADHRAAIFQGVVGGTHETLANDGPHGAPHERELESRHHDGHAQQRTAHRDQRVFLARLLLRCAQAVLVLLAIAKFQAIDRFQVSAQLSAAVGVEEDIDAGASANAHVVIALGADVECLFQFRTIEYRIARRALVPQAFRHRALLHLGTHDRRDQFVY